MKMYDVHAHLGKTSSGESNSAALLVEELNSYGITKVGISSLSGTSTREQNDLVHDAMMEFPGIVKGYAFINPKAPDVHEEIDKCLGEYKMDGVKFHPWKHGYYSDNCPQIDGVLDQIETYGVHIQVHVGTSPLCTPFPWIDYAIKHPNLRVLFTHMGCREFGYSTIEAIKDIKNIWVETSCQMEQENLKKAAKDLGSKRIVFGSDWPYKPTNVEIEKIQCMGFNEAELEDVFYKNAEYLWTKI
ncbi:MAG: amidohydrolase family protein [Bacilli bacterium]